MSYCNSTHRVDVVRAVICKNRGKLVLNLITTIRTIKVYFVRVKASPCLRHIVTVTVIRVNSTIYSLFCKDEKEVIIEIM